MVEAHLRLKFLTFLDLAQSDPNLPLDPLRGDALAKHDVLGFSDLAAAVAFFGTIEASLNTFAVPLGAAIVAALAGGLFELEDVVNDMEGARLVLLVLGTQQLVERVDELIPVLGHVLTAGPASTLGGIAVMEVGQALAVALGAAVATINADYAALISF